MNKQELENEDVRQEEKKTKKKKVRKKKTMFGHIRSIISILLVVGIIGGSYWYYAFQYRAEVEPETNRKVTNTDSVYTMEQYLKTLKRNQTVYKYACDEAEVDKDAESKRGRRSRSLHIHDTTGTCIYRGLYSGQCLL